MRNKMLNLTVSTLVAILFLSMIGYTGVTTVDPNKVISVYNYDSSYALATSVYDPVKDMYTFLSHGYQRTGYYGTDESFIVVEERLFNANGTVKKVVDPINGTVREFDTNGKITAAYTEVTINGEKKRIDAKITYDDKGRLASIEWKGWVDVNDDGKVSDKEIKTVSKEFYRPDGRTDRVESYVYHDENGKVLSNPEKATTYYRYDGAGNIIKTETYDKDNKIVAETHFVYGRPSVAYTYSTPGDPKTKYKAAQWNYEGHKLVSVNHFNTDGKVEKTTYMDKHGRASYSLDAMGREIERWFYNDTGKSETQTVNYGGKQVTVTVAPGGILKKETYSYSDLDGDGNADIKRTDVTLFHNGSENFAAITYTAGEQVLDAAGVNRYIKSIAPNIPIGVDPTVTGTLRLENGIVFFDVTDKAEFDKIIRALNEAIAGWGTAVDADLVKIRDTLQAQWNKERKVSIAVGAIHDDWVGGSQSGGTQRQEVSAASIWDDAAMIDIINRVGQRATLTWTYWAMDSAGRVWLFV